MQVFFYLMAVVGLVVSIITSEDYEKTSREGHNPWKLVLSWIGFIAFIVCFIAAIIVKN